MDDLFGRASDVITVRRVFGEPVERDGVTLVPAARVAGGGGGGGDAEGSGGGGFGVYASPVGAYVIRDGRVTWKPALDPFRIGVLLLAALWLLGRRS